MKNLLFVFFLFATCILSAQAPNTSTSTSGTDDFGKKVEVAEGPSEEEIMVEMAWAGAHQGDPGAMAAIGMFHYLGIYVDTVPNFEVAYHWLQKAAKYNEPVAIYFLGKIYQEGIVVDQDLPQALKLFRKAARANMPLSYVELGYMYEQGQGVKANPKKAEKWYARACEEGIEVACNGLLAQQD
jgi:TPR repeat protein